MSQKTTKTKDKEIRAMPVTLEIRETTAESGETRTISGAIKYDSESQVMRDWYGDEFVEVIAPGAFSEYMQDNGTVALWCHRTDQILGNTKSGTLRLTDTPTELRFECDLPNSTIGTDAWENIRRGDVDGVSFGFNVRTNGDRWSKFERDGNTLYKRTVLIATLPEVSMTPFAAYPGNEVSVRSLDEYRESEKRTNDEYRKRKLNIELDLIG